jgi:hypothetical protein
MRPVADRRFPRPHRQAGRRLLAGLGLAVLLAGAAAPALAQKALTVYGGLRSGGDFTDDATGETISLDNAAAGSLSFDWTLADGRQAQLFYAYQRSALPGAAFGKAGDVGIGISMLHLGGRAFFDGAPSGSGAYAVGGIGATYFSPGLDGLSSELRPSMNLGLGVQWPLARQVVLRAEARGYITLINSNGGFFCSGGCVAAISGDTLVQFEGMVGLSVGF